MRWLNVNSTHQAWTAFLISSAFIIGTFLSVVGYGYIFLNFPVFLFFGCDSARSNGDCWRIQLTPFVPVALTLVALIGSRVAIRRSWYVSSMLGTAVACAFSWLFALRGFGQCHNRRRRRGAPRAHDGQQRPHLPN
jgi:hypothetical protein